MAVWADVFNPSGTRVATIHDVLSATADERIDQNGAFDLTVPVTAAEWLVDTYTVKLYATFGGAVHLIGGGRITRRAFGSGGATLRVSGPGLLAELADTQIRNGQLWALKWVDMGVSAYPGNAAEDTGFEYAEWNGASYNASKTITFVFPNDGIELLYSANPEQRNYIYVGYFEPFRRWRPSFSVANASTCTLGAQYMKFSPNTGLMTWTDLTITDGTSSGGATFAVDNGEIAWTIPSDWSPSIQGGRERFWVRFFAADYDMDVVRFDAGALYVRAQDTADVDNLLTNFGPPGWAVSGDYYDATTSGTYWPRIHGISVLGMLREIATRTGEHFRRGSADKEIDWLRADQVLAGILASQGGDPNAVAANPSAAIIRSLSVVEDGTDRITRLYVEGAGQGDAAITLHRSTDTYTGITVDRAENYVEVTGATPTIAASARFPDISSNTGRQTAEVANELLAAAVAELNRRRYVFAAYRLELIGVSVLLRPGEWIDRVLWTGPTAARNEWIEVDQSLYLVGVRYEADADGIVVVCDVADVAREPLSELDILARRVAVQSRAAGQVQAITLLEGVQSFGWVDNRG